MALLKLFELVLAVLEHDLLGVFQVQPVVEADALPHLRFLSPNELLSKHLMDPLSFLGSNLGSFGDLEVLHLLFLLELDFLLFLLFAFDIAVLGLVSLQQRHSLLHLGRDGVVEGLSLLFLGLRVLLLDQGGASEHSPSDKLLLEAVDRLHDGLLSPLDGQDLSDLLVVEDISNTLGLQFRQLDEEVHAAVGLSHEFDVAVGLENLALEHDDADHNAVEHLHSEVLPAEDESTLVIALGHLRDIVIVAEQVLRVGTRRDVPDLSEADVCESSRGIEER
mmetsp:Transcript_21579/g.33232  ORF Transcript_21579/g.33232 Transcript_21579/m.33232 type:complete len:278 (+) Transcript_21579:3777-4610(+)